MLLVGRWSPSKRTFRVRVFANKKRAPVVPAARIAQAIQAIDPATLGLSSSGIAVPLAND